MTTTVGCCPNAEKSALLEQAAELSQDLIGLQALGRLEETTTDNAARVTEQRVHLDAHFKPKLEVVHGSTRPVRLLVEALR